MAPGGRRIKWLRNIQRNQSNIIGHMFEIAGRARDLVWIERKSPSVLIYNN